MKAKQQPHKRATKEKCYNETAIIEAIHNLRPFDGTISVRRTHEKSSSQRCAREIKTKQKLFNRKGRPPIIIMHGVQLRPSSCLHTQNNGGKKKVLTQLLFGHWIGSVIVFFFSLLFLFWLLLLVLFSADCVRVEWTHGLGHKTHVPVNSLKRMKIRVRLTACQSPREYWMPRVCVPFWSMFSSSIFHTTFISISPPISTMPFPSSSHVCATSSCITCKNSIRSRKGVSHCSSSPASAGTRCVFFFLFFVILGYFPNRKCHLWSAWIFILRRMPS